MSGANSRAAPPKPTSMPRIVGRCSGSPPGSSASAPTIQNGEMVMIRHAKPLGTHSSAKTRAPLPMPSTSTPLRHAARSSRPRGSSPPRSAMAASISAPETT